MEQIPQGATPVDASYVYKSTRTYAINHNTIYILDGKYYTNGFEFAKKEDADAYADSTGGAIPDNTWVDDGEGKEYPKGTDNVHSGAKDRLSDLVEFLSSKHGIHFKG
jgi:hypothetical protein